MEWFAAVDDWLVPRNGRRQKDGRPKGFCVVFGTIALRVADVSCDSLGNRHPVFCRVSWGLFFGVGFSGRDQEWELGSPPGVHRWRFHVFMPASTKRSG